MIRACNEGFQGDRHMPVRGSGRMVRFHHGGNNGEAFGDGEVVYGAERMGLNSGGAGIHIDKR